MTQQPIILLIRCARVATRVIMRFMVIVTKGSASVIMEVMIRIKDLGILNISADTLLSYLWRD